MVGSSYQQIWRIMGVLQEHYGEFGERALADILGASFQRDVKGYLGFLANEKIIARRGAGTGIATRYSIVVFGEAPPHRRGYAGGGDRQHAIWNAIRSLRNFSVAELAIACSTEELPVSQDAALDYVNGLTRAGYVRAAGTARRSRTRMYALLPARNTGPRAPVLDRGTTAGFDLNLMRTVNLNDPSRRAA
jgi:hypothetical protein